MTPLNDRVADAIAWLERRGSKKNVDGMARYGIVADHVLGVSVSTIRQLAKTIGRDHELALALWETGIFEARILTAFVDEPAKVTASQMDRMARDFDNWAICDTHCLHLFDKTPHAWSKVHVWSSRKHEFTKRAAFALLAGLSLHDKRADDQQFLDALPLIERAATDERNYVKKGVSWALRTIGRRNVTLHEACIDVAARLLESSEPAARWIGRDAHRELTSAKVRAFVTKRAAVKKRAAKVSKASELAKSPKTAKHTRRTAG